MSVLAVGPRTHHDEGEAPLIETPSTFAPVFNLLNAEKIDHVLTKLVYEIDWEGKKKVTINIIANVSSLQARILGYMPVAGVTLGAFRISSGVLKLGLAAASLGACRMFGLPQTQSFTEIVTSLGSIKHGVVEVMPLAFGAAAYLADYAPPVELLVTDLKISRDKMGVLSEYCHQTAESAFAADKDKYLEYKPWAKTLMHAAEKTYQFATEGVECLVTCAAWGDIGIGLGALAVSPYTGGGSLTYGLSSIARGALALGASSLLEIAEEYDLKGKVTRLFTSDDGLVDVDDSLCRLQVQLSECAASLGGIYEALEEAHADA